MIYFYRDAVSRQIVHVYFLALFLLSIFLGLCNIANAQIVGARLSGFTWISTEHIDDSAYGSGYTMYSSAYPVFKNYPGPADFQTGLSSSWLTTQRTENEPDQFYTTIEGDLGWWHDTSFGTCMDADTRKIIEHGKRIRICFKQKELQPMSVPEQIVVLLALTGGLFDTIPTTKMKEAEIAL